MLIQFKLLERACKEFLFKKREHISGKVYENGSEDLEKVSLNIDWLETAEGKEGRVGK